MYELGALEVGLVARGGDLEQGAQDNCKKKYGIGQRVATAVQENAVRQPINA